MVIFGCMGKPGGGWAVLTPRFMRHFNVLAYVDLDKEVVKNIYTTIMNIYLDKFNNSIKEISSEIINCTIELYENIKLDLLPIPGRSHY